MRTTPERIHPILEEAVNDGTAPALAALVGKSANASPLYFFAGGSLKRASHAPCTSDTLFDLASLTKVLSTTLIAAEAINLGKLDLSEKPFRHWPALTVSHLLQHTSGLPALHHFYLRPLDRNRVMEKAMGLKLEATPGSRTVYSDVGFIVLGALLEKRLKERLNVVFTDLASRHYEGAKLRYGCELQERAAPTGTCAWRYRHLQGEVNDLNAFAMEGIAPHAGLFGTVHDVAQAARFFLQAYRKPASSIEKVLQRFMQEKGERPLGFDRAGRAGSTDGALSPQTIGHLGFTGTSMWIDPINDAYFVLLTNHVEAGHKKTHIMQLRRDFHRAAARLL